MNKTRKRLTKTALLAKALLEQEWVTAINMRDQWGDTCGHSTVSDLRKRANVSLIAERIKHSPHPEITVYLKKYKASETDRIKLKQYLDNFQLGDESCAA